MPLLPVPAGAMGTAGKPAEEAVHVSDSELAEIKNVLAELLSRRGRDRVLEERVHANVERLVLPYLDLLKKRRRESLEDMTCLNIMESNLKNLISSFTLKLARQLGALTPKEILIANLVREGKRDKEIAMTLNLSIDTIKAHRRNIRKKLGISGTKTNLSTYLSNLDNNEII